MENENKNAPAPRQGERKKHHHKPKGYFIDPNQPKPSQNTSEGAVEQRKEADKTAQRPAESNRNRPNHKKRPQRNGGRDGEKPQKGNTTEQKNAAPQPPKAQNTSEGDNRPKNNRNRHKGKQRPKPETAYSVKPREAETPVVEASAPTEGARHPKKSYERPISRSTPAEPIQINTDEYEAVSFPSIAEETNAPAAPVEEEPAVMIEVVGIRFKSSGKTYYFSPNGNKLKRGEHAIVETARGLEYGDVAMGNSMVKESDTVPPLRPVIRAATPADVKRHEENKKKEDEAFTVCNEKILAHKLDMKLIDAQYTFDNSKLLFYFTSSGRVDFRELVKDLAGVFRTRIELRQIGIRDEAKIMGGVGMCGRPLCCTLFLSDFGQVSIKMAKEQNLSLNCAKISGICGRLMCCLRYEHEAYEYEIKRTPPVDSLVQTADGTGTVTEINPLKGTVKVRLSSAPDNPPKLYPRDEVVMLQKKTPKGGKSE